MRNTLEAVELNGSRQWISVRGRDEAAPVLLFLHGGPGHSELSATRRYFAGPIEERFVVVNWDQRGTGKSFRAAAGRKLTVDLMLEDLGALVDLLLSRFSGDRLFILGHSWGSVLGLLFSAAHPERVAAYGGIGQVVSGLDNERVSYRWALAEARRRGDARAIRGLQSISSYAEDPLAGDWFRNIQVERKWLRAMGGGTSRDGRVYAELTFNALLAPEYSPLDKIGFVRGMIDSVKQLWPEIVGIDLRARAPRLGVPAAFFMGRYDFNTPQPLAAEYLSLLEAPRKEMVWFEESAHSPCFEEPARFAAELVRFFLGG